MAVSPRLSRKFQQTLGAEAAEDLVHWMDHVDAQSQDVRALIARVEEWRDASWAELRSEIGGLRSEMRAEMDTLRAEMGALRSEMRAEIAQSHAKLITWSFVFWATTLGAVVLTR